MKIITRLYAAAIIYMVIFSLYACKRSSVNPPANTAHNMMSFTLGGNVQVGETVISRGDTASILVYVKQGTDLASVQPVIVVSDKASVSPASGLTVDFTKDSVMVYTVTSQAGQSQKWYVQVKVFPKPDLSSYQPNPQPETEFQQYFTRYSGWNSGDGAQSILLPDGRTLWLFGDSFVGPVNADRTRGANNLLINNAAMIQDGSNFTSHYGGTEAKPQALFIPADPNHFYWTRHGFTDGDKLYLTLMELYITKVNNKNEIIHYADRMAVLSLPDMKFEKMLTIPYRNKISYGDRCFTDGGYNYIFGSWSDGWSTKLYLARAAFGKAEETWEFYAGGESWIKDINKAVPLNIAKYVTAPTVINRNGRYYLVTQRNFFSKDILMFRADKPEGPYTDEVKLYTTPGDISTYLALGHPQFIKDNRLLIGYSVGGDIFKSFQNVDICVPKFIRVTLPE